jgi:formylglycine-generating enzyme required for sulfatase activity
VSVSDSSLAAANIAWFRENSNSRTNPVGDLDANRCGLHDVHGNVWEWVEDGYQESYSNQSVDPVVTPGSLRVLRGGSWFNPARSCRSANRNRNSASNRDDDYGFRLLRTNN